MDELSWDDLEHSLAHHLAVMPEEAIFTLYVDESSRPGFDADFDDHPRYVQFLAYGQRMVRCEVVSNTYLPDQMRHTVDDLIRLRASGWSLPADEHSSGSPNIYLDVDASDEAAAARAAGMTMRVFRDVWHVRRAGSVICDADKLRGPHAFEVLEAPADFRPAAPTK